MAIWALGGPIWAQKGLRGAWEGLRAHMGPNRALWAPMGGSYGHIRGEAPLSQPGPLRALRPARALGGPWEGLFRGPYGPIYVARAP